MERAEVTKYDLGYRGGFINCACGWKHDLGDGFNGYHIANCPQCTPELHTHSQRKVMYNDKIHPRLRVDIGDNRYFVLSNGLNVRYAALHIQSYYGLTEEQADRL